MDSLGTLYYAYMSYVLTLICQLTGFAYVLGSTSCPSSLCPLSPRMVNRLQHWA